MTKKGTTRLQTVMEEMEALTALLDNEGGDGNPTSKIGRRLAKLKSKHQ
jgi:hypothetical protein